MINKVAVTPAGLANAKEMGLARLSSKGLGLVLTQQGAGLGASILKEMVCAQGKRLPDPSHQLLQLTRKRASCAAKVSQLLAQ